ncbi:MAG TPA: serine hydrolase domain-containing protein [Candidatus Limnocylindrales bacterium]|nr:serine hydrolase domain-containing protein [Candidatus Limnocylindrales bacterium]
MLLPDTERALLHRLATAQRDGRAPSIAGAVVRDGRRAWSGAIETTTDTQFRIGSLTKTFVAVLVMRLRDEGRLGLDDPLEEHLSDAPIRGVTIGQLLSHTAGIASESPGPWWERTPGEVRPELADIVGEEPQKHPPGWRFHYSNPGFGLLGAVVEELRGRPLAEVLQREILDPLEMARTSLLPRAPHAQGLAVHPWADMVQSEVVHEVGRMAPAGQLWSTVEDLCRFAGLLAAGADGVLSADTVAEMREPRSAPERDSWESSYGLGVQLLRTPERMLAGHTGSMPGFLCALWVSVEDDAGAAALANTTAGLPIGAVAAELVGIVAAREPRIPSPWRPLDEVDPSLLELTGAWFWGPSGYSLRLEGDRHFQLSSLAGTGSRNSRFRPAHDGTWIGVDNYFAGETLRPVRDREGRITHLDIGSFVFTREPYDPSAPIPGGTDPDGWRSNRHR